MVGGVVGIGEARGGLLYDTKFWREKFVGIGEARGGLLYNTKFWREKFLAKQYTPKIWWIIFDKCPKLPKRLK